MKNFISIFLIVLIINSISNAQSVSVNSYEELKSAIENLEPEIDIESDLSFNELLTISGDIVINGNDHTITRDASYTQGLFSILSSCSLEINDLTIDGGAPDWKMDIENAAADSSGYFRADLIEGDDDIVASQPVIINLGDLTINSSVFQNIRNGYTASDKSGGAIRHSGGKLNINDSKFIHVATYREGGALYINKGTVVIKDSLFDTNAAGAGYKARAHGGAIYVNGANSIDVDNTTFKDNFAQHNGGAIMLQTNGSDIKVSNSSFNGNSCGNDGSALSLESTSAKHSILIEDCTFDGNLGLALTGQSMGTVWLDAWKNDSTMPAVFKDLVFKNNHSATGSTFASYGTHAPYCEMDNIESFNNTAEGVGGYFIQSGTYLISNANIHDNTSKSGGAVASVGGTITISDSIINNNTALQRGGGPIAIFGSMTIKDTEITNNHSNGYGGGIAAYSMYANYGSPELHLENVLVKDNTANISGGGLSIQDTNNAHSIVTVDNLSKIYDNSATVAGDDVIYSHANATAGADTTLDNIGIAGLLGIDGWYLDFEDDRFKDTDNPTVFNDFVNNDGSVSFYLKAAGVSTASYDGNGAETNAMPVTVKYGETYIVDDDIPTKDGYTFQEWNTKPDGTGISLKAGDTYDGSDGYVLYAILTPNQYTITFDTNGGTTIAPIKQEYNTDVVAPNNPEKEGYTFKGWDKEIPAKMPAEDMTITASWEANEYTITFDTKGGNEIAPIKQAYNTDVIAPDDPVKEGYTFKGWDKEIPAKMPAEDMTITASWEPKQYTIIFDTKGGNEITPIKQEYNTDVTAPKDPTREGYTFKGWDIEIPAKMPAKDMTITAKWEVNKYTITYDTDGGTEIEPQTLEYGENVKVPNNPTKSGYVFVSWDKEIPKTMPAEDVLVTASWRKRSSSSNYSGGSSKKKEKDDDTNNTTEPTTPTTLEEPVVTQEPQEPVVPKESGETKVENNTINETQPIVSGDAVVLVNTSGESTNVTPIKEPEVVQEEPVNHEPTTVNESSSKSDDPSTNLDEINSLRANSNINSISETSDKEPETSQVIPNETPETTQNENNVNVQTDGNENPQTDDNIIFNMIMLGLSFIGVIVGIVYYKKSNLVKNK